MYSQIEETTMTTHTALPDTTPGEGLNPEKMPGHWLLARMGKRVLRPGGLEVTNANLAHLAIDGTDDVVEIAPGFGETTRKILTCSPASYTGVERDAAAAAIVRGQLRGTQDRCIEGTAQASGLDDACADVVTGEAFLTMQSDAHKQHIVNEAFRLLRPGGRYGLHEMSIRPDSLGDDAQDEIRGDLARSIHVGARPLTVADWRRLLENAGFVIEHQTIVGMLLLEPRRLLADEGVARTAKFAFNVLRDREARRRVRTMRETFHKHGDHIEAIGIVARKPAA